jgi:ASCH domain
MVIYAGGATPLFTASKPWAHLVVSGIKRIENRTWRTNYRGPLLIHAGVNWHDERLEEIEERHALTIPRDLPLGGVVGMVELVDVVLQSDDPFFHGPFGWVLANARSIRFRPLSGHVGVFDVRDL